MASHEQQAQEMARLYREVILAHAVKPHGHNRVIQVTHRAERNNPLCGDHISIELEVHGHIIRDAAFHGEACAICLASASLLCGHAAGQRQEALAEALAGFTVGLDEAGLPVDEHHPCPEYLAPLLGVRAFPARTACATLPWETAIAALDHPLAED